MLLDAGNIKQSSHFGGQAGIFYENLKCAYSISTISLVSIYYRKMHSEM